MFKFYIQQQRFVLLISFLLSSVIRLSAQTTTLYSENFDYADGTTSSSLWTIGINGCNLTGTDSHFEVLGQRFEGRDLNCQAVWYSNVLNIAGYKTVNASMAIYRAGSMTSSDYMTISYKLNGGSEIPFASNGTNVGNFTSGTASQTGLNGSTLQLVVRVYNTSASQKQQFANVEVTGTNPVILPLALSVNSKPASCEGQNNGSISLSVSGGVPPYSYLWSNNATTQNLLNISQGGYEVTVTDSRDSIITAGDSVLTVPPLVLSFTEWNSSPDSANGFAKVSISGGTPPYSIEWSTGDTSANIYYLAPANYGVGVSDSNACSVIGYVNVDTSSFTTLFYEDFDGLFSDNWNAISNDNNLTNHWGILDDGCSIQGYSLEIMDSIYSCTYNKGVTQDILTYTPVNVTGFGNLTLGFTWSCTGELNYDYGSIWYSLDSINWERITTGGDGSGWYSMHPDTATEIISLPDTLNDQKFYLGFNWNNDNTLGTDYPFVVDNIYITGMPYAQAPTTTAPLHPNSCTWIGGTDSSWFNSVNWDCKRVPLITDSVIITPGTPFTANVNTAQNATCNALIFKTGSNLVMQTGRTLLVDGDVSAASAVALQAGNVIMAGDTVQHINLPLNSQFFNLSIQNNSDTGVVLLSNVNVANTISLISGYLVTGNDTVSVLNPYPNGSAILSYSNQSHIVGNLRRYISSSDFSYEFPVGNMADSSLFVATITPDNLQGVNYLNAHYGPLENCATNLIPGEDTGVYAYKICREGVWVIEPDNTPTGGTYDIKLGIQNIPLLRDNAFGILKRPVGTNESGFTNGGGVLPPEYEPGRMVSDGYAERSQLAAFSEFAIASFIMDTVTNYVAGTYNKKSDMVKLTWNNKKYNKSTWMERSEDAEIFKYVPKSSSQSADTTELVDEFPLKGLVFYRLGAITDNGDTIHSDVLSVNCVGYADGELLVFPNPCHELVNIRLQTKETHIDIAISDMNGDILYAYSAQNTGDLFEKQVEISNRLAAGEYFVRVMTNDETFIRKITVVR